MLPTRIRNYEIVFPRWHVGQCNIEHLAIVVNVDHHAVYQRPPVVDLWGEQTRLLLEPFDDRR